MIGSSLYLPCKSEPTLDLLTEILLHLDVEKTSILFDIQKFV